MAKKIDKALRYWVMSTGGKVIATFKTLTAARNKWTDIASANASTGARVYDRMTGRYL